MKRLSCVMIAVILLAGCSAVQITEGESIALQIAAKRVGFYVGKENSEIVAIAKVMAQGVADVNNDSDALKMALNIGIEELVKQFPEDPLLESDLKLIVSSLQINMPDSKLDIAEVKPLVSAFIEGLEIGAAYKK